MKYYIAENGQGVGPFEANELLARGLTGNSLVWGEGMSGWTSASQVPELAALLSGQTGNTGGLDIQLPPLPPMGQAPLPSAPPMGEVSLPPLPDVPPVTNPQSTAPTVPNDPLPIPQGPSTNTQSPSQAAPKTWLVESVIATLVCSLCCGVPLVGLIPGAIAIFHAWGCRTCYAKGDIDGAKKKSVSAKKWFFITIIVGVVLSIYGTGKQLMSNPDILQDILNGNTGGIGFFYGI